MNAPPGQRVAAGVAAISVGGILAGTLIYALGDSSVKVRSEQGSAKAIGQAVFSGWLLPFELLSVLLLAALVAAIAISRPVGEEQER